MQNTIKLILVISLILTYSCKSKKNAQNNMGSKEQYPEAIIGEITKKTDPCRILEAKISGNFIEIEVQYGGGCVDLHGFELIGSPNLAKSLPPKRSVKLIHDKKDDLCKALVTKTLKFSITNLAESTKKGNKIILNLDGYDQELVYSYE